MWIEKNTVGRRGALDLAALQELHAHFLIPLPNNFAIQHGGRFSDQAQPKLIWQVVNIVYWKQCAVIGNIYKLASFEHFTGMSLDPSRNAPSPARSSPPSMKYGWAHGDEITTNAMPTPYKIQNKLMASDGAAFQPTLFYVTVLYFGVGIKSD
jgi:hypothetical protein